MRKQKDDSAELLSLYADGPAMLEAALVGLSESGLDRAKAPGEWTIRQIVHHVVDGLEHINEIKLSREMHIV